MRLRKAPLEKLEDKAGAVRGNLCSSDSLIDGHVAILGLKLIDDLVENRGFDRPITKDVSVPGLRDCGADARRFLPIETESVLGL